MKTILYFLLPVFALSLISCTGTKLTTKTSDLKKSKHFRVLADAYDDDIFVKLQDDLGIDPKMERYTIVVDIRNSEPSMQYLLLGDEDSPKRFAWRQVSEQVQKGLLNWSGTNKERLD
jgi:hypothetical protein